MELITQTQADIFLASYRKTGLLQKSARQAGLTKHDIEAYAKKQSAEGETFALNLQQAAEDWSDTIRAEITRRAIDGVDEDVFYKGEWIASKRVYSDTLLSKMAEAALPEYKKQAEQPQAAISIQINTFGDAPKSTVVIEDITPYTSLE
jgi:hypothetical protein